MIEYYSYGFITTIAKVRNILLTVSYLYFSAKIINARMKERARRNPILAEKTPRVEEYKNWDYAVPSARPPTDRWNYPTEPVSLLARFASQKEKIIQEDERMRQYYQRLASFEEKDKVRRQLEQEAEEHKRRLREIAEQEEELKKQESSQDFTSRSTLPPTQRSTARSVRESPRLTSIPIGHITSLNESHPEVLQQWRAQRAAEYISSHALTPTAHNTSHEPLKQPGTTNSPCCNNSNLGFRPAGSSVLLKTKALTTKNVKSKKNDLTLSPKSIKVLFTSSSIFICYRKIMLLSYQN